MVVSENYYNSYFRLKQLEEENQRLRYELESEMG